MTKTPLPIRREIVRQIEKILPYITPNSGMVDLVYRPPAAALRYQADRIEKKERDISEFMDWFRKLKETT